MKFIQTYLLLLVTTLVVVSCGEDEPKRPRLLTDAEVRARMDSLDQLRAGTEKREIMAFLEKKGWPMTDARSGVWYWIYEPAHKDTVYPVEGDVVSVRYEVRLLNDTLCYTNLSDELPRKFMVKLDNIESGVHEGITYMTIGDKARLVMPSIRAHGLLGDMDKIPPSSPIWFDIELVGIQKKK